MILQYGMQRMLTEQRDEYFYLTLMNENYAHPDMPEGAADGIIKGMYLLSDGGKAKKGELRVQLMGSGTILREAIAAAELLDKDFGVKADIWSCPSFNELAPRRRRRRTLEPLAPEDTNRASPTSRNCSKAARAPRSSPPTTSARIPNRSARSCRCATRVLGTDGFGRSDTRENLRRHFEVDRYHIAHAAVAALAAEGKMSGKDVARAIKLYKIDAERMNPLVGLIPPSPSAVAALPSPMVGRCGGAGAARGGPGCPRGELLMLVGPSGCGKTTLMSIITAILEQDGGECGVLGQDLQARDEPARARLRKPTSASSSSPSTCCRH